MKIWRIYERFCICFIKVNLWNKDKVYVWLLVVSDLTWSYKCASRTVNVIIVILGTKLCVNIINNPRTLTGTDQEFIWSVYPWIDVANVGKIRFTVVVANIYPARDEVFIYKSSGQLNCRVPFLVSNIFDLGYIPDLWIAFCNRTQYKFYVWKWLYGENIHCSQPSGERIYWKR